MCLDDKHQDRKGTLMGSFRVVLSNSLSLSFSASCAIFSPSCLSLCAAVLASRSSFAARNFCLLSPSQREALNAKACGLWHEG